MSLPAADVDYDRGKSKRYQRAGQSAIETARRCWVVRPAFALLPDQCGRFSKSRGDQQILVCPRGREHLSLALRPTAAADQGRIKGIRPKCTIRPSRLPRLQGPTPSWKCRSRACIANCVDRPLQMNWTLKAADPLSGHAPRAELRRYECASATGARRARIAYRQLRIKKSVNNRSSTTRTARLVILA